MIAEIGAASLLQIAEILTEDVVKNSAAYIDGWLNVLKEDDHFITHSASAAEKAVNYII